MKTPILIAVIILGGALAAYYYWQHQEPEPRPVQAQAPLPPPTVPSRVVRQVIEAPPAAEAPLPELDASDSAIQDALNGLVQSESLMKLFRVEQIIRKIVATIDNLPGQRMPARTMPLEKPQGNFIVDATGGTLSISQENAERYKPYVSLAEATDAKKLVALYIRLYPLFQKAYEELGYPGRYFNDRLIVVIDHLLATPDPTEPVRLIQPKFFYLYAAPDLEALSIGQKTLMRIGSSNEAIVKNKLKKIKTELLLHMHEEELAPQN
jgi:DUF3014 family protein